MVILCNKKWDIRDVFSSLRAYVKTHKNTHPGSFPATLERQSLCNPINCSPPCSSVLGTSQARYWNELPFPSPGIFLTQGLSPCLLHCQADSLPLSHQRKSLMTIPVVILPYKKWGIRNVFFFLRATEKIQKSTHSRSFPTTLERKSISLSGTFSVLVLIL